jgi:hypothetical protein
MVPWLRVFWDRWGESLTPYPERMAGGGRGVKLGLATVVLALLGWIGTSLAMPFLQHPGTTEDLTAVWQQAGGTPLGQSSTVAVPPGQTLVAFLVGTDLYGIAGTTGGSCTAGTDGRTLDLGWPVQLDWSLTDVLNDGQQSVAIGGWTNSDVRTVRVTISCSTADSTVDHYVAVPSRTAMVIRYPWFQPWGWAALAAVGLTFAVLGVLRANSPGR